MTTDDMIKVVKTSVKLVDSMLHPRPKYHLIQKQKQVYQLSLIDGEVGDDIMRQIRENWERSEQYHCIRVNGEGEVPKWSVEFLSENKAEGLKTHFVSMRLDAPWCYTED